MTDSTARLSMPLLQPGQAQKELYHNEALALLDLAVHAAVEAIGLSTPPGLPAAGACWIVGDTPTGAWSGHAGAIAGWTTGGWRFVEPPEGTTVWSVTDGMWVQRLVGDWLLGEANVERLRVNGTQVVGAQAASIGTPVGGATIDAEARMAVTAMLAALRAHGLIAS